MKLLKFKKFTGLHIVCKKCNKNIEVNQAIYKGCSHPIEKQKYKALFKIDGIRKTKDLKALGYDEAIKELLVWKDELANPIIFKPHVAKKESTIELFEDFVLMFSDWLQEIDVPRHERKNRSEKHVKETMRYMFRFQDFLKDSGYNLNKLTIFQIDRNVIGKYYEHLENEFPNPSTFNHNLRALKNFFKFIQEEKQYPIVNPIIKARLKEEFSDPKSITDKDFIELLSVITEENSLEVLKTGKTRNRWRPWMKNAIELFAFTGMRLEETVSIKYSDIKLKPDGSLHYVEGIDLKYNRARKKTNTNTFKKVNIPMTSCCSNRINSYHNNYLFTFNINFYFTCL